MSGDESGKGVVVEGLCWTKQQALLETKGEMANKGGIVLIV